MPKPLANTSRYAAIVLGILAGLIGSYHGYNETLQGSVAPGGVFINAVGPPCQGSGCFPAMTLVPNFLFAGATTIIISLIILVFSAGFVQRPRAGIIIILLSIVQLLVGGGFLPPALGLASGILATRIKRV